jgi:hypothetical protein
MNVVLQDFDKSVAHFKDLYDADFMIDLPQDTMHAAVISIGRFLFEIFVPHEFLLISRYGAHYVGVEYDANMDATRKAVADHKLRIVRDIGIALHTNPQDAFGTSFEFTDAYFHDREWPGVKGHIKTTDYWRKEHALGMTGMWGYTAATYDINAAVAFYKSFLSAEVLYEAPRAHMAARAIGLKVADATVELLTPTGDGVLLKHLREHGEGIRSSVFTARDAAQVKTYFDDRNIKLDAGTLPGGLAVPAEANLGVIFEFVEGRV